MTNERTSTRPMHGEIITIGDELLSGRVMNLNGWYAASRLSAAGFRVDAVSTVRDDGREIARCLQESLARSDFIIVTGGLGPTDDDVTAESVAGVLGRPLVLNERLLARIKEVLEKSKIPWNDTLEKLAWLPRDATLMDTDGNMCGFSLVERGVPIFFLPGVPDEMSYLLDRLIIPALLGKEGAEYCAVRTLKLFGVAEHQVGHCLSGMERTLPGLSIGYYPNFPEVHVVLTCRGDDRELVDAGLSAAENEAEKRIGEYIIGRDEDTIAETVGRLLKAEARTLSVAESCTGGLIGHLVTEVPGSSDYFERGFIVYSNRAKIEELGVPAEVLERHGAVSGPTAEAMASGVRAVSSTHLGLAVTGIAGPGGGSEEKPVGTVYIGLATEHGVVSKLHHFKGGRSRIKMLSAHTALDWIRRYAAHDPFFHRL